MNPSTTWSRKKNILDSIQAISKSKCEQKTNKTKQKETKIPTWDFVCSHLLFFFLKLTATVKNDSVLFCFVCLLKMSNFFFVKNVKIMYTKKYTNEYVILPLWSNQCFDPRFVDLKSIIDQFCFVSFFSFCSENISFNSKKKFTRFNILRDFKLFSLLHFLLVP